jgi:hypothetical protein
MASPDPAVAQTVTASRYGFSFSLPAKWTDIPLSSKDLGALLGAVTQANPALKGALSQEAVDAAKEGIKAFAVGPVSGDFVPNLNVLVKVAAGLPTGSTFVNLISAEAQISLGSFGATQVHVGATNLPLGQAVRASYLLKLKFAGHPILDRGLQLYFEHFGRLYVVTFSSLSLTEDQSAAHVVEHNWHWLAITS